MNFGTLQSIQKEPQPTAGADASQMAAFGSEEDADINPLDSLDGDDVASPISALGDKLLSLRDEIDQILSDMGLTDGDDLGADLGADLGDDVGDDLDADLGGDLDATDHEMGADLDDPLKKNEFSDEVDDSFSDEPVVDEDPDFQGDIRTVTGANLVYKRKTEEGNYEELWIYKVGDDVQKEVTIRRAILAGTDIVPSQRESEDGTQEAETTTLGNVQYLKISGLPN